MSGHSKSSEARSPDLDEGWAGQVNNGILLSDEEYQREVRKVLDGTKGLDSLEAFQTFTGAPVAEIIAESKADKTAKAGLSDAEEGSFGRPSSSIFLAPTLRPAADEASIAIQRVVRGHLARRTYAETLLLKLLEEEELQRKKERQRLGETFDLLDSLKIQQELEDLNDLRKWERRARERAALLIQTKYRNYRISRLLDTCAIVIQKAWVIRQAKRRRLCHGIYYASRPSFHFARLPSSASQRYHFNTLPDQPIFRHARHHHS